MDGLSGLYMPKQEMSNRERIGQKVLDSADLKSVYQELLNAVSDLRAEQAEAKVMLLIDQPDLLLAAGGEQVSAPVLGELLMGLREVYNLVSMLDRDS